MEWTSQELGDGAGYDIRSFDPAGKERLIEVKVTRGGPATDFFLTAPSARSRPNAPTPDGSTAFTTSPPLRACSNSSPRLKRR
ncbi:DUF3883 domain-containing protein [Brevundimonas sp. 3P9-tot-E]|uniref:DUF3883 domain-containing protein n=1 Tax=Brevundimonas TaxID=41275 RepID=UPI0034D5A4B1